MKIGWFVSRSRGSPLLAEREVREFRSFEVLEGPATGAFAELGFQDVEDFPFCLEIMYEQV